MTDLLLLVVIFIAQAGGAPAKQAEDWRPKKIESEHVPNLLQITENVLSGGLPHGEGAFEELQKLGVKTVISVDGAAPDVAAAEKAGLRYIHLPHGYDGISESRILELAKAVSESDGPVLIHCHRGKHRSPAAATATCAALGLVDSRQSLKVLEIAGTGKNYLGLFEVARNAKPIDTSKIRELKVVFQSKQPAPPLIEAMVELEVTLERLELLEKNGWQPIPNQPDLEPAHQALLLRESYTELLRQPELQSKPEPFQKLMQEAEETAKAVESEVATWKEKKYQGEASGGLRTKFALLAESCKKCHAEFRDNVRRNK
jgi:protein tyrosine phosphatase (PTP) superfamily phosphohydrolase (DUF442 family)